MPNSLRRRPRDEEKKKKERKKKNDIIIRGKRGVLFAFVSFRFVEGYEFFSGGEMGGWVGGQLSRIVNGC